MDKIMGNIAGNTDTVTGVKRISGSVQIENASAPLKHDGRIVPGMIMGNFLRADADPVDALGRRALQVRDLDVLPGRPQESGPGYEYNNGREGHFHIPDY